MVRTNDLISVIVPIYNSSKHLSECIQSILSQSYNNLEIILIDDGSTDSSLEICNIFAKKDIRIKVYSLKNGGVSAARNYGLTISKGVYISFVDSDDMIDKDMYVSMISAFDENQEIGCAFCNYVNISEDSRIIPAFQNWNVSSSEILTAKELQYGLLSDTIFGAVWNKLFRKDLLGGLAFAKGRLNEDFLFCWDFSKVLSNRKIKVAKISSALYYYRINPVGLSKGSAKILGFLDVLKNSESIMEEVSENAELSYVARNRYYAHLLGFIMQAVPIEKNNKEQMEYYMKINSIPITYLFHKLGIRHKIGYFILRFFPQLWCISSVRVFCTNKGTVPPIL